MVATKSCTIGTLVNAGVGNINLYNSHLTRRTHRPTSFSLLLDPFLGDCIEHRIVNKAAVMPQIITVSRLQAVDIAGNFDQILYFMIDADRQDRAVLTDQLPGALQRL